MIQAKQEIDIYFPRTRRPYFIVAPSYTDKSSGVRTLHLLCHALNVSGERAFIISSSGENCLLHPDLNTPILTRDQRFFYEQNGPAPIAVYPDITKGNPLGAKNVVRYLMAPRGAYGGDETFPETDNIWGGLPSLAEKVLRVPVSDTSVFRRGVSEGRSGSCFYSHKYDRIHGNLLLDLTKDSTRLEGTLQEIADILRASAVCYLYEMSSILTEASLCDTPVVLLRTPYFNSIDPDCMGANIRWHDGEVVKHPCDYRQKYYLEKDEFPREIAHFIYQTQGNAHD